MFLYKQINLNLTREIRNSIQDILGVGWYKSILVCSKMGLSYPFSCGNLNLFYFYILSSILDFVTILEVRIKRFIYDNISRSFEIQSYKGFRHKDSLPSRGQRTRTNASTKKRINYNLKDAIEKKKEKKVVEKKKRKKVVEKKRS